MIRHTTKETKFCRSACTKNSVSVLMVVLIALAACSPAADPTTQPTPTIPHAVPTPASVDAVTRLPDLLR